MMILTALGGYGYAITHSGIGMDDTAVSLYFHDGLAPYVGRWTLYLLGKVFHITDYFPYFIDLVGTILLILSATLWNALWKSLLDTNMKLPIVCYGFVGATFISCPLISEVFIYYLHNGVCMGYGLVALALYLFTQILSQHSSKAQQIKQMVLSALLLCVAVGCYESFMLVFIMGAILLFFMFHSIAATTETKTFCRLFPWLLWGIAVSVSTLLFRMVALFLTNLLYDKTIFEGYDVLYRTLFGDNLKSLAELGMTLKRFLSLYYIHGFLYLPIKVLVLSIGFLFVFSILCGIKKKDIYVILASIALILCPIIMTIIEGNATKYRAAQYVPMLTAFSVLLFLTLVFQYFHTKKWGLAMAYVMLGILIFNQCSDMNKWFYLDYQKYLDARETMYQISYDLKSNCDTTKPIAFIGAYKVPSYIRQYCVVSYSSKEFQWICRLTDPIDVHWKEKFYKPDGYCFTETPEISILQWGLDAFNHTAEQVKRFGEMHGLTGFDLVTDPVILESARSIAAQRNMPGYPYDGYIYECEDYIIVNIECN